MAPRLIEGHVEEPENEIVRLLERELAEVRRELAEVRAEASRKEGQALKAIQELQKVLRPVYRGLQLVFGEIEAVVGEVGAEPAAPQSGPTDRVRRLWESWKVKLGAGSAAARFIDALLEHGELSTAQMKAAGKMGTNTVYRCATKLKGLGLLNDAHGRYSLRSL